MRVSVSAVCVCFFGATQMKIILHVVDTFQRALPKNWRSSSGCLPGGPKSNQKTHNTAIGERHGITKREEKRVMHKSEVAIRLITKLGYLWAN